MSGRLAGKVAAVTGGSTGIGEAIVRRFAAEGAEVFLCGRDEQRGAAVEKGVRETGASATFMRCDVSSEQEVEAWIAGIVERSGGLDTVVNNAGIAPGGPFVEMTLDVWDEMLRINVTGAFLISRAAIPHLIKRPGSSIIMIGSTASFIGLANAVAYGMTKASLVGLAKGLAVELADTGVRVNALCPGGTMTPATKHWLAQLEDPQSVLDELEANHPIGRLGTPDEQAAAAVFLASDDAGFMTGSAMLVDGGYTAR